MWHAIVPSVLFLLTLTGCDSKDIIPQVLTNNDSTPAVREEDGEKKELIEFRAAMDKFLSERLKIAEEKRGAAASKVAELRKDIETLASESARVMSEKTKNQEETSREVGLLRLMMSKEVNTLANKYLARDFSRDVAAFKEAVRFSRGNEKRYHDALKKSDELYFYSVAESEKWAKATASQREAEIVRITQELRELEAQRKNLLHEGSHLSRASLKGGSQLSRERAERAETLERKLADADDEIDKKRKQIDYLRHPDFNQRFDRRTVEESQNIQRNANRNRELHLRDIERHLRPKKMVSEVVTDYEGRTIDALQKTMAAQLKTQETIASEMSEVIDSMREAKSMIPVADLYELKSIRKKFSVK